ncbi:probable RNA 3'-terminal phosphate cyclase-like protein [Prunus persica]|uniref:probable RNA 3'-terminal phosphate cyclase-like protein n=1 Tax=Prunus persica TaxID=3760 RepID=UPI0009AB5BAE|nr:probable RNA 3'-terminal phosphate cyclase-like protein [Prunus persica]
MDALLKAVVKSLWQSQLFKVLNFENTMVHAARGVFHPFLPDVHIFTDHRAGPQAGESHGYGMSLVAETTSGCYISADTTIFLMHEGNTYLKLTMRRKSWCLQRMLV